jgi:hypothetical protein
VDRGETEGILGDYRCRYSDGVDHHVGSTIEAIERE